MGCIVALANQKGGVGKTTSAVNIAASLGILGKKVLLIDLDPQGSATSSLGVSKKTLRFSAADLLISGCTFDSVRLRTSFKGLDLIPANVSLAATEFDLIETEGGEAALRRALAAVRDQYDLIVLDCPPSLGMLTVNAMVASDGVIIPMQCEFFALEGLVQLMTTIKQLRRRYNPRLAIVGILATMFNNKMELATDVLAELKRYYPDQVFETAITRHERLSEAPGFGMPVYYHDKNSPGAAEYLRVAKELLDRV
ncbi:MAG: ParA family protein [Ruminococcaceae bacterium]|nr:ParA family protein [Oscillospiraceae bacterium]